MRTLTANERQTLASLEARVDQGLEGTAEAIEALLEIQRLRLYESVATDFSAYCESRWPRHRDNVRRLLGQVNDVQTSISFPPPDEDDDGKAPPAPRLPVPDDKQAAELARLPDERSQREVWGALVRNTEPGKRIRPTVIRAAVDSYLEAASNAEPDAEDVQAEEKRLHDEAVSLADAKATTTYVKTLRRAIKKLQAHYRERVQALATDLERHIDTAYVITGQRR